MRRVVRVAQKTVSDLFMKCALCVLAVSLLIQMGSAPVFAQQSGEVSAERKTRKAPTLSLKMYEKLKKAQVLSEADDLNGALEVLGKLREPKKYQKYNAYEKAMLWNFFAFIYYGVEDYPQTESAYKRVLEQPDLPEGLEITARYSLAQIYFVQEKYRDAVDMLETWFKMVENPSVNAYILLGQGYYQIKEYIKAIPAIEKAITINRSKQLKVKENWYLLLRAMYCDQEDYLKTFQVLNRLVNEYPKKEYYAHLSALYGELKHEFNRYSTIVAMHDAAMLNSSAEQVGYAQLLLQNERPYRAAVVLDGGLKRKEIEAKESTYKLLGNAWILARENDKAIPALESAAKLSKTGDIYVVLGQSYLNIEEWTKAVAAIGKALKKGGLTRKDTANVVQGMAYFNLAQYNHSIQAFKKARKDTRSVKIATQWLRYVQSERGREKRLEAL